MKRNHEARIARTIITIILIAIVAVCIVFHIKNIFEQHNHESIKSSMLQIQGACNLIQENVESKKENAVYIGTVLTNENDEIIDEFNNKGILTEEEYPKFYVLHDQDLLDLKLNFDNEDHSYYLINYETQEVIITKGYEGKYKLSEME